MEIGTFWDRNEIELFLLKLMNRSCYELKLSMIRTVAKWNRILNHFSDFYGFISLQFRRIMVPFYYRFYFITVSMQTFHYSPDLTTTSPRYLHKYPEKLKFTFTWTSSRFLFMLNDGISPLFLKSSSDRTVLGYFAVVLVLQFVFQRNDRTTIFELLNFWTIRLLYKVF